MRSKLFAFGLAAQSDAGVAWRRAANRYDPRSDTLATATPADNARSSRLPFTP